MDIQGGKQNGDPLKKKERKKQRSLPSSSLHSSGAGADDNKNKHIWDFPGSPVVKTPRFHCRGHGLAPWSGN